ncbi:MAG: ABC transporter ATP-binding protein, partial [Paracoccus denitrificans]
MSDPLHPPAAVPPVPPAPGAAAAVPAPPSAPAPLGLDPNIPGVDVYGHGEAPRSDAPHPAPVLEVRDLTVAFRTEGRRSLAVRGVSFTVGRGETVA